MRFCFWVCFPFVFFWIGGFIFWTHVLFSVFCMGVGLLGGGVHVDSSPHGVDS